MSEVSRVSDKAREIHRQAIVIDALTTSILTPAQAERMRAGGVTATNHTAARYAHGFNDAVMDIVNVRRQIAALPGDFQLVLCADDITTAKRSDKLGIVLGLQNAMPIENNPAYADVLYALGVRVIQLTYNERNFVGDGCIEPGNAGLSRFGINLISQLNDLGVLVDLSHCGYRTTSEAIEASEKPVAITHANPLVLSSSPRNKPDDILRRLAANGGVLGLCAWTPMSHRGRQRRPDIEDLLDFVDYAANIMGPEHLGIGTDHGEAVYEREAWEAKWGRSGIYPEVTSGLGDWYGFDARYVEGLSSASMFPNLTDGLLRRGYADKDVIGILGGNFHSLFQHVWK